MTKEEILAMEAGRELDALIAEKVMGWKRAVATDGATEYWDNGSFCSGRWVEPTIGGFRLDDYSNTWNPSESISAAWEVKNAIKEKGLKIRIVFSKELQLMFRAEGTHELAAWPSALFLLEPIHICKAALLALIDA